MSSNVGKHKQKGDTHETTMKTSKTKQAVISILAFLVMQMLLFGTAITGYAAEEAVVPDTEQVIMEQMETPMTEDVEEAAANVQEEEVMQEAEETPALEEDAAEQTADEQAQNAQPSEEENQEEGQNVPAEQDAAEEKASEKQGTSVKTEDAETPAKDAKKTEEKSETVKKETVKEETVKGDASAKNERAAAAGTSKKVYDAATTVDPGQRVWFCSVDCGDFILVESNGHWGLIDTGERTDRTIQDANGATYGITWGYNKTGEEAMRWAIENLGITHLDFVLITHAHSDHIGGVPYIANMAARKNGQVTSLVDTKTVYIRKPYLHINALNDDLAGAADPNGWHNQAYWYQAEKAMQEQGAVVVDISQGQTAGSGSQPQLDYSQTIARIEQANPVFKNLKYAQGNANNWYDDRFDLTFQNLRMSLYNLFHTPSTYDENVNSIAAVIRYGDRKIFTAGDLNVDNKVEQRIANVVTKNYGTFDVVKAGHHGYDGSNGRQYLDKFQPKSMIVTNITSYMPNPSPSEDYAKNKFGTKYYMVGDTAKAVVYDLTNGSIKQYVESRKALGSASNLVKNTTHSANGWTLWTESWNPGVAGWVYYRNGALTKGQWILDNGLWYWMDADGYMARGLTKVGNQWFYLNDSGAMITGWLWVNNGWMYFTPSYGNAVQGLQWMDGYLYYFDYAEGKMQTGWHLLGTQWYYFTPSGNAHNGWLAYDGGWCYLNYGQMLTGWQYLDGYWYFMKPNGKMAANEWYQGCWFDGDGVRRYMATGSWRQDSRGWWYGDDYGWYACNGWVTIDGKVYHFDRNGYVTE